MSTKDTIIRILKDNKNKWISSSLLVGETSISRAAVSKHISKLKGSGYVIESAPKKGHKLIEDTSLVLANEIKHNLTTTVFGKEIKYYQTIDSSNKKAMEFAFNGAEEGLVIVAEEQTEGRGLNGAAWDSPLYKGIYLSTIVKREVSNKKLTKIALNAAVKSLKIELNCTNFSMSNDGIYYKGQKVGGVLVESLISGERPVWSIVGLGIILSESTDDLLSVSSTNRSNIAKQFLGHFEKSL